jgi:hypothetical protein
MREVAQQQKSTEKQRKPANSFEIFQVSQDREGKLKMQSQGKPYSSGNRLAILASQIT